MNYIVTKRYINLDNNKDTREIWRPIIIDGINYTELYEVSNLGRVKSLNYNKTGESKILKPAPSKGYLTVVLSSQGVKRTYKVHRLVATMFLPNPRHLPQVNHVDEVKTNNCADNLEWCNNKYNHDYGNRNKKVSDTLRKKSASRG